nr:WGxxGxxG family protein [Deinococcus alpinitundrae]
MKNLTKTTLVVLAFALAPLSAYAQDTTSTDTTTPAATDTTTTNTTDTNNNDKGFDYGWLGLLGLAGLAGLNRKQPPVVHVDPQRQ